MEENDTELHPETLELIDQYIAQIEPGADRDEIIQSVLRGSIHPSELEYALSESQWGQAKQDPMNYNGAITGSYYEDENDVDEGWKGTLAGSALGSIAGDAAGSVIGPLAGGALGGAVGGLPGAIAGTAAGAVAGGPVGGAIGGLAGGKIGDKLGGQEETKEAKTGDIVKGAVKAATQGLGDIFGGSKPKDLLTPVSEDPLARIKTLALKQ